jgi:hypothetical protein
MTKTNHSRVTTSKLIASWLPGLPVIGARPGRFGVGGVLRELAIENHA